MVDTLRADTLYGGRIDFPLTPAFATQAKDAQLLDAVYCWLDDPFAGRIAQWHS